MRKLIDSRMVGKTIKSLRESRHMSQSEVADLVFYSERNIRRIENNGTSNIEVVNRFAEVFNVSALDILDGDVFFLEKTKKHWQLSPYNAYSNLFFIHMHARPSYKLRSFSY